MQHSPRPLIVSIFGSVVLLGPLAGCAGFGGFVANTFNPVKRPYVVASNTTENVALAHGKQAPTANLTPQPGQPWPTSYPMDPTIMSIESGGNAVP